ncbi:MAG TPA: hypothetical protein PLJ78_06515 [Anaerolineae bacterium]|nr:hypothetical protein [Anaerolineae bacterium]HQK13579.1 hypothetical protein [Anaerolineae bacterium]
MNETPLYQIACPNCHASLDLHRKSADGTYVHCEACGSEFMLKGHLCPYCGTYHEQEVGFCHQCGAGLMRRCPKCDTVNWIGNEYCTHCGTSLDILELIVQRYIQDVEDHLYVRMDEAERLKAEEMAASQARMERMLAEEREFQAAIHQRLLEQKLQEQKILKIALSVAAVLFVVFVIVALLMS